MSAKSRAKLRDKRLALWRSQDRKCCYCGVVVPRRAATLDHIVPKAMGGGNVKENLCVACWRCNQKKANKSPHAFHAELMMGLA